MVQKLVATVAVAGINLVLPAAEGHPSLLKCDKSIQVNSKNAKMAV